MNRPEELMRKLTEADEFNAQEYFTGNLSFLTDRGFERVDTRNNEHSDHEAWAVTIGPFCVWLEQHWHDARYVVSVQNRSQWGIRGINNWPYEVNELDAALAQVDRILALINTRTGKQAVDQQIERDIRAMQKAPMVGEDVEDLDGNGNVKDEGFDPREYMLAGLVPEYLKTHHYERLFDSNVYSKPLYNDTRTAHFIAVNYDEDRPGTFVVEYQKHVNPIGFVFPWSDKVDSARAASVLPVLESAIKSAAEQRMPEGELKVALDALVRLP